MDRTKDNKQWNEFLLERLKKSQVIVTDLIKAIKLNKVDYKDNTKEQTKKLKKDVIKLRRRYRGYIKRCLRYLEAPVQPAVSLDFLNSLDKSNKQIKDILKG